MGFRDNISDFYHWMVQFGNVNAKSRTNYISWLKFMAGRYELDVDLSEDKIQTIINDERNCPLEQFIRAKKTWLILSLH